MFEQDLEIAKKHIDEILAYQAVLSNLLKRKITVNQAITDWIEKGYVRKYRDR